MIQRRTARLAVAMLYRGGGWHRALALSIAAITACTSAPPPPPAVRFIVPVPDDRILSSFAVSADGERLAYSAESTADGRRRIFIRTLTGEGGKDDELADTQGGTSPFFSPDGSSIAYFARGALWRKSLSDSAAPARVTDAPTESAGGTWTPDGRIIFAPLGQSGLMYVPAGGGTAAPLTELNAADGELEHGWPHALPGGAIVFTVSEGGRDPHVEVLSAEKQRTRLRVPIIGQAQFVETGHLVYSFLGNLMAVKFDLDNRAIDGVPAPIAKGIQTSTGYGALGRAGLSVSRTGTLVWLRAGTDEAQSQLMRVERDGRASPLAAAAAALQTPRLSPDGRRLAVVARSGVMTREIRVLDAATPERVVRTIQGGDNQSPAWMDNRRLTFGSNRDGLQKIYVVAVDGTRAPTPLFTADATVARNPASWSRPPRLLALYEIEPARGRDVLVYRIGESIAPVAATDANERSPAVSFDGRWIAFVSNASGRDEVYAARLDRSGDAIQLTVSGATEPVWAREGLFYRDGENMILRPLVREAFGAPQVIFEGHFERDPGSNLASYDVDAQGRFFVMLKSAVRPRELRVVKNWGSELP